jgi:hypothetical protein
MSLVEEPRFADPTEQQRLWELTIHEDNVFSDSQNLFVIAESMLVAGHAATLDASAESAAVAIGGIGLVLTLAWAYVSWRQGLLVEYIQSHARRELREYRELVEQQPMAGPVVIRSRVVFAFVVPLLLATLWILLLVRLA